MQIAKDCFEFVFAVSNGRQDVHEETSGCVYAVGWTIRPPYCKPKVTLQSRKVGPWPTSAS